MRRAKNDMGKMSGYRQVTLYVDPALYERVRCAAYTLDEDIYIFANEALSNAVTRRMTKEQRAAIEITAKRNIKNSSRRESRR